MKTWRRLSQAIGAISLMLSLGGYYLLFITLGRELRHPLVDAQAPLFRVAFFTITLVDGIFLAGVVFACVGLLRAERKAQVIYTWLILVLIAFQFGLGIMWLLPNPVGKSIAAATGIGSMGVAPLLLLPVPFAYPLVSVVLVNLSRHKLKVAQRNIRSS